MIMGLIDKNWIDNFRDKLIDILNDMLDRKQPTLVSGDNIRTINGENILDLSNSSNIVVQPIYDIIEVTPGTTSLNAAINKYYRFVEEISVLDINIPTMTDYYHSASFVLLFATDSNSASSIRFRTAGEDVLAPEDFQFKVGHTYEITAKFNGVDWILSIITVGSVI